MNRNIPIAATAALLTLALAPATAAAGGWSLDTAHTSVGFKVRHLMVSWVRGSFGKVDGKVTWDGKDPKTIKADIAIDAASIDTKAEKRDAHLRSADFFDVKNHPKITFRSTAVRNVRDQGFELVGDLSIRGVTRQIVLSVEGPTPVVKGPWGAVHTGAHAKATIDREQFGLTWNKALEAGGVLVGKDVQIELNVELNKR